MKPLKSKTGCLTCVARKKKCDENKPRCTNCERLGLSCVRRVASTPARVAPMSTTNTRRIKPRLAISNGYPAFRNELEKHITANSPAVFRALVSPFAHQSFSHLLLLGRLCTQSLLVRCAVVAFVAGTRTPINGGSRKLALINYQHCISILNQSRPGRHNIPADIDHALTATLFLGLLEGLGLGDSINSIIHLEMCRKLLGWQLLRIGAIKNEGLLNIYRVAAEAIMYSFSTLSPRFRDFTAIATDWGTSFDCLFPQHNPALSPVLGGFHEIYQIMFQINSLLWADQTNIDERVDILRYQLYESERKLLNIYPIRPIEEEMRSLYIAKFRLNVYAMDIHLTKIAKPRTTTTDPTIQLRVQQAVMILKNKDLRENQNPTLRWPLTILACAAHTEDDFNQIILCMRRIAHTLHPGPSRKLEFACDFVQHTRSEFHNPPQLSIAEVSSRASPLDQLLEPQKFGSLDD